MLARPLLPVRRTLPSLLRSMTTQQAHPTAVNAFDANHTLYDKVRPEFKPEIVDSFFTDLGLTKPFDGTSGQKILELAVGTGKFTKQIVKKGWGAPENYIAVEPSSGMLESFKKNFPQLKALQGSSYEMPVGESEYDAVIVAQGYHWFADEQSLKEIYRVLKPGGKLGLIWNFDMLESDVNSNITDAKAQLGISDKEIEEASGWGLIAKKGHSYDTGLPQYRRAEWRKSFKNQPYFDEGSAMEGFHYQFIPFPKEMVYDYWLSRSYITSLPDNQKATFKKLVDVYLATLRPVHLYDENTVKQFLGTNHYSITCTK